MCDVTAHLRRAGLDLDSPTPIRAFLGTAQAPPASTSFRGSSVADGRATVPESSVVVPGPQRFAVAPTPVSSAIVVTPTSAAVVALPPSSSIVPATASLAATVAQASSMVAPAPTSSAGTPVVSECTAPYMSTGSIQSQPVEQALPNAATTNSPADLREAVDSPSVSNDPPAAITSHVSAHPAPLSPIAEMSEPRTAEGSPALTSINQENGGAPTHLRLLAPAPPTDIATSSRILKRGRSASVVSTRSSKRLKEAAMSGIP